MRPVHSPMARRGMPLALARLRHCAMAAAFCVLPGPLAAQAGSPAGPVPPQVLAARREAVIEAMGQGIAILRSAAERPIGAYAQDSDYREDNDFFYLTGLEAPGAWLVLGASRDGEDRVTLYLPARDARAEAWTGPKLGPGPEATSLTGIPVVREVGDLTADLLSLRPSNPGDTVWAVLVRSAGCAGQPSVAGRCAPGLSGLLPGTPALRDLRPLLMRLRSVKDAEEQRRLRRAVEITAQAQLAAAAVLQPGMWEYELEAEVEYTFRRLGAERVGFPSIIGSGPNSTVLHYDKNRRRMEAGDLVVIDIGAEYGYYTADITRTWPVSGRFTPRQRGIYELVLGAQQAAIDAVKPGVTIAELTQIAQQYMRMKSGRLCGSVTCDTYFVHGLSHHIGMDVHDAAPPGPLRAGMVFTIEPGIYIPAEKLGVRIEDDVLVTPYGHELLSGSVPRRVAEIERLLAEAARRRHRSMREGN